MDCKETALHILSIVKDNKDYPEFLIAFIAAELELAYSKGRLDVTSEIVEGDML